MIQHENSREVTIMHSLERLPSGQDILDDGAFDVTIMSDEQKENIWKGIVDICISEGLHTKDIVVSGYGHGEYDSDGHKFELGLTDDSTMEGVVRREIEQVNSRLVELVSVAESQQESGRVNQAILVKIEKLKTKRDRLKALPIDERPVYFFTPASAIRTAGTEDNPITYAVESSVFYEGDIGEHGDHNELSLTRTPVIGVYSRTLLQQMAGMEFIKKDDATQLYLPLTREQVESAKLGELHLHFPEEFLR